MNGNGLVTSVGKGSTTITVSTANGKKAKCKIKVEQSVADSDIDLARYYGGNPIELANVIGGLHCEFRGEDGQRYEYGRDYIGFTDDFEGKVEAIWLGDRAVGFTICGVKPGISKDAAIGLMKGNKVLDTSIYGSFEEYVYGIKGTFSHGHPIQLRIEIQNDIVVSATYAWWILYGA